MVHDLVNEMLRFDVRLDPFSEVFIFPEAHISAAHQLTDFRFDGVFKERCSYVVGTEALLIAPFLCPVGDDG
jgi:hypothetical protein